MSLKTIKHRPSSFEIRKHLDGKTTFTIFIIQKNQIEILTWLGGVGTLIIFSPNHWPVVGFTQVGTIKSRVVRGSNWKKKQRDS